MEYTTLSKLKTYLGITWSDQDSALTSLITVCSEMLSLEIWDDLSARDITRRLDWSGTYRIVLENNVNSVASISYTYDNGANRTALTFESIEGAIVYCSDIIPKWSRNIKVVYNKGFTTVPKPLEEFFLKYVQLNKEHREQNSTNNKLSVKVKQANDMKVEYFGPGEMAWYDDSLRASRDMILKKYKNFNMVVIN